MNRELKTSFLKKLQSLYFIKAFSNVIPFFVLSNTLNFLFFQGTLWAQDYRLNDYLQLDSISYDIYRAVDIDADGDQDILSFMISEEVAKDNYMVIFLNNPDGFNKIEYPDFNYQVHDVSIGDIDNDDDLDFAIIGFDRAINADNDMFKLVVFKNTNLNFKKWDEPYSSQRRLNDIKFLDANGEDEYIDIFAGNVASNYFINDGNGKFSSENYFEIYPNNFLNKDERVDVDLDNDGINEIILPSRFNAFSDQLRIYKYDETRNRFETYFEIDEVFWYYDIEYGDLDKDGDQDIIIAFRPYRDEDSFSFEYYLVVYENTENGFIKSDKIIHEVNEGGIYDINLYDFDRDGIIDISFTETDFSRGFERRFKILLNGQENNLIDITTLGTNPFVREIVDFDSDGDVDLLTGDIERGTRIYINKDISGIAAYGENVDFQVTSLVSNVKGNKADFQWLANSNDIPDLQYNIILGTSPSKMDILKSNVNPLNGFLKTLEKGNVSFSNEINIKNLPEGAHHWQVQALFPNKTSSQFFYGGAFFIDSPSTPDSLDVEVLNFSSIELTWRDNSQKEEGFVIYRSEEGSEFLELARISSDITTYRDNTLLAGKEYSYRVQAFAGESFSDISDVIVLTTPSFSIDTLIVAEGDVISEIVDLDGDNDKDLLSFMKLKNSVYVHLYENNEGTYTEIDLEGFNLTHLPEDILLRDFNQDGLLDVFLNTGYILDENTTALYINKGEGRFELKKDTGLPKTYTYQMDIGDVNNDGHLDMLLIGYPSIASIYLNDGNARFDKITDLTFENVRTISYSSLVDTDNDGDLDVLFTGENNNDNDVAYLYENKGDAYFEVLDTGIPKEMGGNIIWGDADNDGDQDLLFIGTIIDGFDTSFKISLFKNNGENNFIQTDDSVPEIDFPYALRWRYSLGWYDLNNDGFIDILCVFEEETDLGSYIYFINEGDGTFRNSGEILNLENNQRISFGDINNDNSLDFISSQWTIGSDSTDILLYTNRTASINTPKTPVNVQQTIDGNVVKLMWDNVGNNASYDIYLKRNGIPFINVLSDISTGNRMVSKPGEITTNFKLLSLPNGEYSWAVQSVDNSLTGSTFSEEITFTITTDVPVAPKELVSDSTNAFGTLLRWKDNSTTEEGFIIERKSGEGPFIAIDTITSNRVTYYNESLIPSNQYTYRVIAVNSNGESQPTNEVTVLTDPASFILNKNLFDNVALRGGKMEWGDYDNDGDSDLVIFGTDSTDIPRTIIYKNVEGNLEPINVFIPGIESGLIKWADFDNDNDLDLFVNGYFYKERVTFTYMLRNDGNDIFSLVEKINFPSLGSTSMTIIDVDNDNDLDFFLSGYSYQEANILENGSYSFYKNQGNFDFEVIEMDSIGIEGNAIYSIHNADFDNDGDRDIMQDANGFVLNGEALFLNNSDEDITFENYRLSNTIPGRTLVANDHDRDMDIDYITTGREGVVFDRVLFANNRLNDTGFLGFEGNYKLGIADKSGNNIVMGDLNHDGFSDIVVSSGARETRIEYAPLQFVAYNDKNGDFYYDPNLMFFNESTSDVKLVDVDIDGDLDIITLSSVLDSKVEGNPLKVYINKKIDNGIKNNNVSVPVELTHTYDDFEGILELSWQLPEETLQSKAYTYNLYLKKGEEYIMVPHSNIETGFVMVPEPGNTFENRSWKLRGILPGDYSWAVQTINQSMKGSDFSEIARISIGKTFSADSLILVDLYNATSGENWTNTWDLSEPVASWHGIYVSKGVVGSKITEIRLSNNNLIGSIPESIGNLESVQYLELDRNQLTDTIPVVLSNLRNLEVLNLSFNLLQGEIPNDLLSISKLRYVDLRHNGLSGQIEVASPSPVLQFLNISFNKLERVKFPEIPPRLNNVELLFNRLTFESLLPFKNIERYFYEPQDSIGKRRGVRLDPGERFEIILDFDKDVTGNRYRWFRNGIPISETNEDVFVIESFSTLLKGDYQCVVTNPELPDVTLYTRTISIGPSSGGIGIELTENKIGENSPGGSFIGELFLNDEIEEEVIFNLVKGEGDEGNSFFKINGNKLYSDTTFDYETNSTLSIRIGALFGNESVEEIFEIAIIDIIEVNSPPTDIILSNSSLFENEPQGFMVGLFSTIDEDLQDIHTYTLVDGFGSNDNDKFKIGEDSILTATSLDFETSPTYSIRVRSDDGNGGIFEKNFQINVQDIPDSYSLTGTVLNGVETFDITLYKSGEAGYSPFIEKRFEGESTFSFGTLPSGLYRLKVLPDKNQYQDLLPTYYVDKLILAEAADIELFEDLSNIEIALQSISGAPDNGNGSINGRVVKIDNNAGGRIMQGLDLKSEPISGINVYLLSAATNEALSLTVSDADGFFAFKDLPNGEYLLKIDYEGIPDSPLNNAIKVNEQALDNTLTVGIGNEIIWQVASVTSLLDKSTDAAINLFPNPTSGSLEIEILDRYIGEYQINIYSSSGKRILYEKVIKKEATLVKRLNLVDLPSGLYSIHITSKSKSITRNFIKN